MRTYEIELTVQTVIKRTITSEKEETHGTLTEAAMILEGLEGQTLVRSNVVDKTPKPPTDKQMFNKVFAELRKQGYSAKQGRSSHEDYYEPRHIMAMADDAQWAFFNGRLNGMMPIHWDSDNITMTELHRIAEVFISHGFTVKHEGNYWNTLEIRKEHV